MPEVTWGTHVLVSQIAQVGVQVNGNAEWLVIDQEYRAEGYYVKFV